MDCLHKPLMKHFPYIYKAAYLLNTEDVIVVITKYQAVEKNLKTKYLKWRLNIGHIEFFKCP